MAGSNFDKSSGKPTVVEDVQIVTPQKRWIRRHGKWAALLAIPLVAATVWAANYFYLAPQQDEQVVAEALQLVAAEPDGKKWQARLLKMSSTDQQIEILKELVPLEKDRADAAAQKKYKAALQIAVRQNIPEGKLAYGKALRDGLIGEKDSTGALKIFNALARELDAGVRTGDSIAMKVRAQMLSEGLGVEPDLEKARELARRAGPGLTGSRLDEVARAAAFGTSIFAGKNDPVLTEALASRMIEKNMSSGPFIGTMACNDLPWKGRGFCRKKWYEKGANAGIVSAMAPYGEALLADGEHLEIAESWFAAGDAESSSHERYEHAVLRAMLAKSDDEMLLALRDMQQHLAQNAVENKAVPAISLNEKFLGVDDFEKAVKTSQAERFDNFVVALRVRGLLTNESFWLTDQVFQWFLDRPDLQRRFVSAALLRKSELFANAIKQGSTVAANSLSRPSEVSTRNAAKPPTTFTFEDAQNPIVLDATGGKSTAEPHSVSPRVMAFNALPEIAKDREEQDKTGYLKGSPKKATGGMSTFKVDNQQGSSDAVARIYLDGIKPAVRSMYVKRGEAFSAQSLKPGTYVFRYRFIGSDDTFESDKAFVLTETKTETGTRYSTVMVTLFKVQGGNMSSRKVDPTSF